MSRDATANEQEFSPYAQLVAALLPRAAGMSLFDPDGELRWTSDETIPPQLPTLVARAAALAAMNEEHGERLQLRSEEPVYVFWLRDAGRRPVAAIAIRWRTAETDPRAFSYVHAMLRPVLECLRRELELRARLEAGDGPGARTGSATDAEGDADLQVLLATPEATPGGGGDVAQLLQQVNDHMQCEFTALLMPERNLVVMARAAGRDVDTSILARAHRQLMSLAQLGKEALLLNEPGSLPGVELPLRALVSAVHSNAGRVSAVLVLFRDREAAQFRRRDGLLADLLVRRAAAVIEARYDALTGLFARQAFEPRVRTLLAERPAGAWSFLYLDADRLHAINDNHGMPVGDRLLVKLGELIRSRLAPGGAAARMGGDRFAILVPASEGDAAAFAEGLRAAVAGLSAASLGVPAEAGLQSSLSVGVAPVTEGRDALAALAAAEAACRAAKRRGRNRVERHVPAGDTTMLAARGDAAGSCVTPVTDGADAAGDATGIAVTTDHDADVAAVHQILAGERLCLHAQLITPLPGNIAPRPHFELLLRVQDELGEPAGPGRFLADAERLGLMSTVDRWVVRETLAQLTPRAQLLQGGDVVLTINLSGQSLAEAAFAEELVASVRDSGIDPKALCFEFGEAAVIDHMDTAEPLMRALRELGCHIALDDFGTGMASLTSLRALPLSMLKIDGCFVRELLKDPRAEGLVQGMIHLARSAGVATVAESVETDEIRLRLTALGVDYGQGFAIARPVPLADAIRDLPTWASVARQRQGGDIELTDEDDTVSAALQEELRRELQAHGIEPGTLDEDLEASMLRLFSGRPRTAAAGADWLASGPDTGTRPGAGTGPDTGGELYPHQAAS